MRPLFMLDGTVKRHPAVAAWFEERPGPLSAIAQRWYEELHRCGTDVMEVMHDNQPTVCVDGAAFAYVAVYKQHVNLGFFQGVVLSDPENLLCGNGKYMRHVKLTPDLEANALYLQVLIGVAYSDVKDRLSTIYNSGQVIKPAHQ